MIIVDENKLKYDTLYNILNDLNVGEKTEEFILNYNDDWVNDKNKYLNKAENDERYTQEEINNLKRFYKIMGNGVDICKYVDYWIDDIKWYSLSNDKMIELVKNLIDVIHEEYRDKNDSLDDIDEVFRILEVMREGLNES